MVSYPRLACEIGQGYATPRQTDFIFFETLRSRVDETLFVAIPANGTGRVVLELYIATKQFL